MQRRRVCWESTEIVEIMRESFSALTRLDAERLEELAASCRALSHDNLWAIPNDVGNAAEARKARDALDRLGHLIKMTNANLDVLRQISRSEERRLEYAPEDSRRGC